MKLDEIMEQYTAAKNKVATTVAAVNAARKKLAEHEAGLKAVAIELDALEGFAKSARVALAVVAKKFGPVLHAEVSGICGKDASLDPAVQASDYTG